MAATTLLERDLNNIWHSCSQMKDYQTFKPVEIVKARGSYLYTATGNKIIDAISSWWCKSLGHNHPALKQALLNQLEQFEHIMQPNTTHETAVALAEKLTQLSPHITKCFFAGDGSCAVEIAMKMSLHSRQLTGSKRFKVVSFENSYHGETALTLSVSDVGLYKSPYLKYCLDMPILHSLPYVQGKHDPRWDNIDEYWPKVEQQLVEVADETTAIIFEPIMQGAGGMKLYSPELLRKVAAFAKQNDIHLIADEIMTGLGRLGQPLACQIAGIQPDFICLSKGLTSGWLPMSVMLTTEQIYQFFYADYAEHKAFLHSHTYAGNPLAASVALATLNTLEKDNIYQRVPDLENLMLNYMHEIQRSTQKITNIRGIGAVVAADLTTKEPRAGYQVFQKAIARGAWLRPLGNTIYWLPPLNIDQETLEQLFQITLQVVSD